MKRLAQALVAGLLGVLLVPGRALPYAAALAWGRGLGRVAHALGLRRAVVLDNLRRAFPEWSEAEVRATARRTYETWGMALVDLARGPALARRGGWSEVMEPIEGLERFTEARAHGRGAILLTGHFGVFAYLGGAAVATGDAVDFLVQTQSNPWVDRWLERTWRGLGVGVIRRGADVREPLRTLRANRCLALVADQDARGDGVFVDFLGRPASTPAGPAALALRTGAPIVMAFLVRGPDGRHRAFVEPPLAAPSTGDRDRDVEALTRTHVRVLEKWVRQHPDHWYWFHRRWKTAPPAALVAAVVAAALSLGAAPAPTSAPAPRAAADSARADEPTVFGGAGASLLPLSPTRVARVIEDVSLVRRGGSWSIEVVDVMVGGGGPETVRVGLPDFESAPDSGASRPTLEDVGFVVDGDSLAPAIEPGPARPDLPGLGGIGRFYTWAVPFGAEEWKLARLTYRVSASRTQGGEELLFYYLNPGTPWRGPSGRVNARFDLGDESVEDVVPGWLRPQHFGIDGNAVVWALASEEPEEDLVLALRAFRDPRAQFPDAARGPLGLTPLERDDWLGRSTPREWRFWLDFVRARRGEAIRDTSFTALLPGAPRSKPRAPTRAERDLAAALERRLSEWESHRLAAADTTRTP